MPFVRVLLRLIVIQVCIGLVGIGGATVIGQSLAQDMLLYTNETLHFYYDIFVVDVNRGIAHNLTRSSAADQFPAWSPDGSQIAFSSTREGRWTLFIMDAAGRNLQRVTDGEVDATVAAWSPDGRYLAYTVTQNTIEGIHVLDLQTGERHTLTPSTTEYSFPVWSPDGTMLAFRRQGLLSGTVMPIDIMVMNRTDLQNPDDSMRRVASSLGAILEVTWSPDSRMIAFTQFQADSQDDWDIEIVDVETGRQSC